MEQTNGLTPSLNSMISFDWWEVHEAAFILTKWPKNIVFGGTPWQVNEQLNRGGIYILNERLNKKTLFEKTKTVLSELIKSIENGELEGLPRKLGLYRAYGKNVSYFVNSYEVIVWALMKGFTVPEELQRRLNIHQSITPLRKNSQDRIKNQTVWQYIFHQKQTSGSVRNISKNHPWLTRYGTSGLSNDENCRAIQRARKELLDENGCYIPKAIPDIMIKNEKGMPVYHFCLLKTFIETATNIIQEILDQELYTKTEESFLERVLNDEVIGLYMEGASIFVINLVKQIILQELSRNYSHPKIKKIPNDQRRKLTIGKLRDLNRKECLSGSVDLTIKNIGICLLNPQKNPQDIRSSSCTVVLLKYKIEQSCLELLTKNEKGDH